MPVGKTEARRHKQPHTFSRPTEDAAEKLLKKAAQLGALSREQLAANYFDQLWVQRNPHCYADHWSKERKAFVGEMADIALSVVEPLLSSLESHLAICEACGIAYSLEYTPDAIEQVRLAQLPAPRLVAVVRGVQERGEDGRFALRAPEESA
jgi:hypothetical protein